MVLNLFFHFSTRLVYKQPKWENFCRVEQVNVQPQNQKDCLARGGSWNEGAKPDAMVEGAPEVKSVPKLVNNYCDVNYTCQKEFEEANNLYRRNVFLILVVLGVLSLVLGLMLMVNEPISLGLSYGGVLAFIIASVQYWSAMDDYLRVIILGLALIVLIMLAYKKFKT